MKARLYWRHHGVHDLRKEIEVPGVFSDYATPDEQEDWLINEVKLTRALPEEFLPLDSRRILLAVDDEVGGTGLRGLTLFKNWAKYFDAYVLHIDSTT